MPTGYYEDDAGPGEPQESDTKQTSLEKDSRDETTALVPVSLCPGLKPGDKLALKIIATHEEEYEVEYDEGDEGEKSAKEQPSMETAMQRNRAPTSFLED